MASEEQVRELAYALWERAGRLEGKDLESYFRAEQLLEERDATSPAAKSRPRHHRHHNRQQRPKP